jgi:hypothetical protein
MSKQTIAGAEFKVAPTMSALVNEELRRDSYFHPNLGGITQGGMANHYPMTILSMQGLGASDEEIVSFRDTWPRYRAHIRNDLGLTDRHRLNAENWSDYLGRPDYLLEFRRVFLEGLTSSTDKERYIVLALERMRAALPMGLFHPIIRLSFACMHGDNGLIADALAYMAIRYFDLYKAPQISQSPDTCSDSPALDCWLKISQSVESIRLNPPETPVRGGSLHICESLCAESAIQDAAFSDNFEITVENLELRIQEICQCALRLYLFEPALTTLHAVTGCQALADLTMRCGELRESRAVFVDLWRRFWVWLTGLFLEKGHPQSLPEVDPLLEREIKDTDWERLAAQARRIPEVHSIKMVFSCKWLFENVEASTYYTVAVINILESRNAHSRITYGVQA